MKKAASINQIFNYKKLASYKFIKILKLKIMILRYVNINIHCEF